MTTWDLLQCSTTLKRSSQMMDQNKKFSQAFHKPLHTAKLRPVWSDSNIDLQSRVKLMCFVISIFPNACEPWTLTAKIEKRLQGR